MLGKTYDTQTCSISRALEVVGERWSLLIIRDALFFGLTRFTDFQRSLGIATNVLGERLESFVGTGIMERRAYSEQPELFEYLLTDKGRELAPALLALNAWGDRWSAPEGPPGEYRHAACDTVVHTELRCEHGDLVTEASDIQVTRGPGASSARVELMEQILASRAQEPRLTAS